MSNYTPGPWLFEYDDNGFFEISSNAVATPIPTASGEKIFMLQTRVAFTYSEYEHDEANARLIAAAPDLLEALKHMAEAYEFEYGEYCPAIMQARAAIAKAEGEQECL